MKKAEIIFCKSDEGKDIIVVRPTLYSRIFGKEIVVFERKLKIKELIEKLEEKHIEFNQTVENYEENGEEDFKIWLDNQLKEAKE